MTLGLFGLGTRAINEPQSADATQVPVPVSVVQTATTVAATGGPPTVVATITTSRTVAVTHVPLSVEVVT